MDKRLIIPLSPSIGVALLGLVNSHSKFPTGCTKQGLRDKLTSQDTQQEATTHSTGTFYPAYSKHVLPRTVAVSQ